MKLLKIFIASKAAFIVKNLFKPKNYISHV